MRAAVVPADPPSVDDVDALLPQTQCTKCGFDGCRPYAQAIVEDNAPINQCPPGGQAGIERLAVLVRRPSLPLNQHHGAERPLMVAVIDEQNCIGCTLCIQACPVDAIVGAARRMHSVISVACTGCDLCLPPCPTDCIRMVPVAPPRAWSDADAAIARGRHRARQARLTAQRPPLTPGPHVPAAGETGNADDRETMRAVVAAALTRARARRTAAKPQ